MCYIWTTCNNGLLNSKYIFRDIDQIILLFSIDEFFFFYNLKDIFHCINKSVKNSNFFYNFPFMLKNVVRWKISAISCDEHYKLSTFCKWKKRVKFRNKENAFFIAIIGLSIDFFIRIVRLDCEMKNSSRSL